MTYLNHDHCERKNIRLLAICPLVQDLWRSPLWGVASLKCGVLNGIRVVSEHGKAKIRDVCMTRVVHKDVLLAGRQYSSETRFRTVTYSLEVTMDHIARVEVAEADSDIR